MKNILKIKDLIGKPGHFLKVETVKVRARGEQKSKPSNKLDIFKNPEEAKKVYAVYARSFNNAVSLLEEAELLFHNKFYARTVALAIMSFEELGKSQIAADYYTGILNKEDYKRAFRDHGSKKCFAGRYRAFQIENQKKGYKVSDLGFAVSLDKSGELEKIRQNALYVSEDNDPHKDIGKRDAETVLEKVCEHINYVQYAEEFNGRIGSKALFK